MRSYCFNLHQKFSKPKLEIRTEIWKELYTKRYNSSNMKITRVKLYASEVHFLTYQSGMLKAEY